jgi:Rieske Fe-S protein
MEIQRIKPSTRPPSNAAESNTISRRTFCGQVLLTSTALMLAEESANALVTTEGRVTVTYPPMKIRGAEAILPGDYLVFNYPSARDQAILLRAKDGEYFAYSRKCAHLGCSVDFDRARGGLTCPCHLGAYDARTGFVVFGPPPRPLDLIILQMRAGGEVWAVGKSLSNSDTKVV